MSLYPLMKCRQNSAIVQLNPTTTAVYSFITSTYQVLHSSYTIVGFDIWDFHALIWSTNKVELFLLGDSENHVEASFSSSGSDQFALHKNFIFKVVGTTIEVLDLRGCLKNKLELNEPQGVVVDLDVCEEYLVAATKNEYIQMWKFEDEFKKTWLSDSGRKVPLLAQNDNNICHLKCNYDGSKVSFMSRDNESKAHQSVLYVYDTILDKFYHHDFRSEGKQLLNMCWDSEEFQQFACEIIPLDINKKGVHTKCEVLTYSLDLNMGIINQDKIEINFDQFNLLGKHEPYVCLYEKSYSDKNDQAKTPIIKKISMGVLIGMEHVDGKTRQDLLNFSNQILSGRKMDAYKILESIIDTSILKRISKFCMKNKLLDESELCFALMHRAYSASTIKNIDDTQIKSAQVALQLGCVDDAEKLYVECNRYDLLTKLHQTCGNWEKSIEISAQHDHVNKKNIHHTFAKHLEALGDTQMAIRHYELSDTHRYEVPRMLFSIGKVDELKKYMDGKKDPTLYHWWASYCEAQNLLQDAVDHYKLAGDISSVVRVYCFLGDLKIAESIVAETSDPAATFHLGQQYEKLGNILRAMQLFAKVGRTDSAANLAMKHGIDKELLSLALQGTKNTMLSSAKYFEEKGCCEEAVLLYQKGGDIEKAIDICVNYQLFDALRAIADNLNEETDPALLSRCGDCLLQHKQFEKSILLLIAAGQHRRAFDLCINEGVQITDKMMELFSKQISEENLGDSKQLLNALAEFCESQGSFHLACRTYTQAGDKIKAMKALIKSGDTEKIFMYANVSRQKQLYVLAASYLQTLNWHNDANIMKKIVQMYTKAAELELLASFYEACAQIEIDGFRDYEKALGAMKEAWKLLSKVQNPRKDVKMQSLKMRIEEVERFVQARRLARSDPNGMIAACTQLLSELSLGDKNGQAALRVGDLYALLIEFYYKEGNLNLAYKTIQTMEHCKLPVGDYVDPNIVKKVYQANGVLFAI